jgi:stage III sporulation protein AA
MKEIMNNILKLLCSNIRNIISSHISFFEDSAFEIRLRINSPIEIKSIFGDYFIDFNKKTNNYIDGYYLIKKSDIDETISKLTLNSIHAYEREMQSGYITIEGGHRVGLGGDCLYDKDSFNGFKHITSLNIRIAREFKGCSAKYLKYFVGINNRVYNTLIVGPPLSGKTTLIRDIASYLSDGIKELEFKGCNITIIDERGEISSIYSGIPQMYVGKRTDILSYCMKKEGFGMSIRALSPSVIISDELGSKDDFEIIQYALKSGVNVITTAHGYDVEDVKKNIYLKNIIENNFFERVVILNSSKCPSKIKQIYDFTMNRMVFDDKT